MKCSKKNIESYLNEELSEKQAQKLQAHLPKCEECRVYLAELKNINTVLDSYPHTDIDDTLLYKLHQIPFNAQKKFSIFHLFPRELAFSAISIIVALYIGGMVSNAAMNLTPSNLFHEQDYFEQISLVSLLEN